MKSNQFNEHLLCGDSHARELLTGKLMLSEAELLKKDFATITKRFEEAGCTLIEQVQLLSYLRNFVSNIDVFKAMVDRQCELQHLLESSLEADSQLRALNDRMEGTNLPSGAPRRKTGATPSVKTQNKRFVLAPQGTLHRELVGVMVQRMVGLGYLMDEEKEAVDRFFGIVPGPPLDSALMLHYRGHSAAGLALLVQALTGKFTVTLDVSIVDDHGTLYPAGRYTSDALVQIEGDTSRQAPVWQLVVEHFVGRNGRAFTPKTLRNARSRRKDDVPDFHLAVVMHYLNAMGALHPSPSQSLKVAHGNNA